MTSTEQHLTRPERVTTTQQLYRGWQKHRFWIICTAIFVAVSLFGYLTANTGQSTGGMLSINNPAPAGAQAASSILRERGVDVVESDSFLQTLQGVAENPADSTTVLFYDPDNFLSPAKVTELSESLQASGGRIVAVAPGPLSVKALSPELASTGTAAPTATVPHGCSQPDAEAAATIDGGIPPLGSSATTVSAPLLLFKGAQTCFIPPSSTPGSGGFLASNSVGDVIALGSPGVVLNQNLASRGNAALTLRLLGSTPKLIWYTASVKDIPVAEKPPSLAELTPVWIFPAALWLLLVAFLGMFWRGRRSGPLVSEPLPVIVKSSETLVGRARLYQDARAIDTAVQTLRRATLTRLARTLRLGVSADPLAVVQAVAQVTGRKQQAAHELLLGATPPTEKLMLSMAVDLTALEEEVSRR